jgi:D-arabinose 1-dehydrogenase-like Zn-dependent alcohol dehydrogenase
MEFGKILGGLGFWGKVQRRGGRVNTPKNGSRVGVLCTWGNLEFCAELRRILEWAIWILGVF